MKFPCLGRLPVSGRSVSNPRFKLLLVLTISSSAITYAQMSTDPHLCGGYQRGVRGFINFTFNANTAPPGMAMGKKFCMWTISPTLPTERFRYNITIRNVNLECDKGDSIGINYFNESSTEVGFGLSDPDNPTNNPLCKIDGAWERKHAYLTTMVLILYVEEVKYGKGFVFEWEEGYDSRLTPGRIRNTHYSFGKPSVAPFPYFAVAFGQNEISTFGFVKANFTDGYVMDMNFWEISVCTGQNGSQKCFDDTFAIFQLETNGTLTRAKMYNSTVTDTEVLTSANGFFIIV